MEGGWTVYTVWSLSKGDGGGGGGGGGGGIDNKEEGLKQSGPARARG